MARDATRELGPLDLDIELVTLGPPTDAEFTWPHGPHVAVPRSVADVAGAVRRREQHAAVLVLDGRLPPPSSELLGVLLAGPADVWHAGLVVGRGGQPSLWDHVDPVSMFSASLAPDRSATSWRVSLQALLVRREVLDQLGGLDDGMATLAGAGLEAGLRWIRAGALVRHEPALVGARPIPLATDEPSPADDLRLVARHRGRSWAGWALQRAVTTRAVPPRTIPALLRVVRSTPPAPAMEYQARSRPPGDGDRTVTVVLPTIDRYAYLVPLLGQLDAQTARPHQVVVVDQTPTDQRRHDLAEVAPALPIEVVGLDRAGQSTARNAALRRATGEMALFIDDDDEIPPTLVADHLARLVDGVDASCGAVDDATAGPPPAGFRHRRASDVFPTNNTMVRLSALERSGLFDPAYDHGPRADHDLGMRLHLAGALMVYDPAVEVFHHHAPIGGLRTHGARKITRAGARRSLTQRNLPAVTQLYLARRYFTDRQQAEARRITLLSTLSGDGPPRRRLARAAVQLALLPSTRRALTAADREAAALVAARPRIPTLDGSQPEEAGQPHEAARRAEAVPCEEDDHAEEGSGAERSRSGGTS